MDQWCEPTPPLPEMGNSPTFQEGVAEGRGSMTSNLAVFTHSRAFLLTPQSLPLPRRKRHPLLRRQWASPQHSLNKLNLCVRLAPLVSGRGGTRVSGRGGNVAISKAVDLHNKGKPTAFSLERREDYLTIMLSFALTRSHSAMLMQAWRCSHLITRFRPSSMTMPL